MVASKDSAGLSDRLLYTLSKGGAARGTANERNLSVRPVLGMPERFQKIKKTFVREMSGTQHEVKLLILDSLESLIGGLHYD
jgi:hypothetical protein